MSKQVRVGIDVGGTFTDVVVIDHATSEVMAQLKVPTTHDAQEGVALGIIKAIHRALSELHIQSQDVIFIAHSTTQATNALLEGDVAKVGIIGMGESFKARLDTKIPIIELAPNRFLQTEYAYISSKNTAQNIDAILNNFVKKGVEVVVSSEAFGVDNPANEVFVREKAHQLGFLATSGHDVSTLYGLRIRTRTAVINGAILPKMIHTATMTDDCVKKSGITAPLMIMRSDGGVMSVAEVHRRPIMTMLSGPAAGIAGALMHERISDGIFIEVGGTSADISVIRDGQPQTKAARVGGHRTYLNTLDVRTLAIAGGSMIREKGHKIIDVGSRSAHIAGLPYACFAETALFRGATLTHLRPTEKDADDYIAIQTKCGKQYALTPTCAANALGLIPETAFAKGNVDTARLAFEPLAHQIGKTVEQTAQTVLEIACRKVAQQIEALIKEYHLDRNMVELVGGGGGAASLLFFTGKILHLPVRLAKNAEVISTIGVALAMVRDTVERNIVDPTPNDILMVRRAAAEAVIQIGAVPETIEVQVEVDTRRHLVRATAFGTTALKRDDVEIQTIGLEAGQIIAARSLQIQNLQNGEKTRIHASYFIDATELGDLLPLTGTDFVTGSESRAETEEPSAKIEANLENVQAFSMCFGMSYEAGADFTIPKPENYEYWRDFVPDLTPAWSGKLLSLTGLSPRTLQPVHYNFQPNQEPNKAFAGLWTYRRILHTANFVKGAFDSDVTLVNYPQIDYLGGNLIGATPENRKKIIAAAKTQSLSFLYYLQTECGFKGLKLRSDVVGTGDGLAKSPYIRESRRIKAVFTIKEQHIAASCRPNETYAEPFYDSVGVGFYRIDLHPSLGGDNYVDVESLPFQIPLGALIPQKMDNLLPVCKNIGTTHITNGCYRLHPIEWNIGESVGYLLGFCLERNVTPRQVRNDFELLKSYQNQLEINGIQLKWNPNLKLAEGDPHIHAL